MPHWNPMGVFHHVHPADYRFQSHTPSREFGGHEIYYDADRLVANPHVTDTQRDHRTCGVAFLGDSFTEAGQVSFKTSFVGILEVNSRCTIKNYAVSSYSPIFYLLQWTRQIHEFNPNLVVVELSSNDISSDEAFMKIAIKDENGQVIAIPAPEGGWLTAQFRKSYLLRFLRKVQLQLLWMYENREKDQYLVGGFVEENPDISGLSAGFIKTLAREVQSSGAQFLLTVVPSKYRIVNNISDNQQLQFSDKWKLFAKANNIPFLDLTKSFEQALQGVPLFFDRDIHFTEGGHRIIASELSKRYPQFFKPITTH